MRVRSTKHWPPATNACLNRCCAALSKPAMPNTPTAAAARASTDANADAGVRRPPAWNRSPSISTLR
ncbi:Uncharacterised protein [Bordetella pertussis]|nr:Uncharacterised protein [Bordetella pertussis]